MSNSDVAARRLHAVGRLPALAHAAFRAAACEIAFARPSRPRLAAEMRERARFHFDRAVRAGAAGEGERVRARRLLDARAERFAASALCRRLGAIPAGRLHLADDGRLDLVVAVPGGERFGILFAGPRRPGDPLAAPGAAAAPPGVDALLVYDAERGRVARIDARAPFAVPRAPYAAPRASHPAARAPHATFRAAAA